MFTTLDDRGSRVRAYRLGMLEALVPQFVPRRARRAPAGVLWGAYWRVLGSSLLWAVGLGVSVGAYAMAFVAGIVLKQMGVEIGQWVVFVFLLTLCGGTMVYARYAPLLAWRQWKDVFLEADCCPGCGYALTELALEADGCTVCPECGAGWKRRM